MRVEILLTEIQHIKKAKFSFDVEGSGLLCIAGKNGTGKTTLVKAIRNITNADTFKRTSSESIFTSSSSIIYDIDGTKITFEYDPALKSLNCREQIPASLRTGIAVELPIPHGERFNFFQKISNADLDIRKSIVLGEYISPQGLMEFLQAIYQTSKYKNLVEISIRGARYYCELLDGGRYLREDYFSSGEYFLISLYKRIEQGCKLIVIDEIDISLDAAAQVRLVERLRDFGKRHGVVFVFTTHSLAMMRTLDPSELLYMDHDEEGVATITNVSYNYVKSILYGFRGWDKYILTEDDVLHDFIEYLIWRYCGDFFYTYKIIFIGGGTNTTDLLKRNSSENFFGDEESVIAILDGDQRHLRHSKGKNTCCIPVDSVEKALLLDALSGGLQHVLRIRDVLQDVDGLISHWNGRSLPGDRIHTSESRSATVSSRKVHHYFKNAMENFRGWVLMLLNAKPKISGIRATTEGDFNKAAKVLHKYLIQKQLMSNRQIFEHLCTKNEIKMLEFSKVLTLFLNVPVK